MMSKMVQLSNGSLMPLIGWGTFKVSGPLIKTCLDAALSAGYRSIDTASVYRNEAEIGDALKELLPKHGLTRSDIFITSKLGPKDQGSRCTEAVLESLERLDTPYLDLFLIHWPGAQGLKPDDPKHPHLRRESWQQLEALHKKGKLRAIGVSNYTLQHMEELFTYCTVPPVVLQTEYHPHLQQTELLAFCNTKGVHFQAYSSLGTSSPDRKLLSDPTVQEVATECAAAPAQVLLRWATKQNIGVLPKSCDPSHIRENMDSFNVDLTDDQIARLSALHQGMHYAWNPEKVV